MSSSCDNEYVNCQGLLLSFMMASQTKESVLEEAKRVGIVPEHLLEQLSTLPTEVLCSAKVKYLLTSNLYKYGQGTFMKLHEFLMLHYVILPEMNTFTSRHILELAEILLPYASRWKDIGTALGFYPQQLDNIQAQHASMPRGLNDALVDVIKIWVEREHSNIKKPTLMNLNNALRKQIVGLVKLVQDTTSIFAPEHKDVPFDIHSVYVDLESEQSKSSDPQLVATAEDLLLIIEVTGATETTSYEWLENGNEVKHEGHKTPLLCIPSDLDSSTSVYTCHLRSNFISPAITISVSCPLDCFSDSLVSMYLDQPEVPEDTWPPVSSKKFINLALIKQEPISYKKRNFQITIRKDLDDIPFAKEEVEYEQLLNDLKSKHVLFIEGRPGSGKTTLVHKITRDWASKVKNGYKGPLRLVLLVSLRVLNSLDKLSLDLVDILDLFRSLKVSKELLEERKGKGVCFIFDGLDEFSPQDGENSVVYRIIKKQYLEKSTVIVASRPAATAHLRSKSKKVVEVLGFLNEQILEYFDCYPFTEDSKVVKLKKYFLDHPNVLHMCYLPIHASMIAYLHDVTGHIPRTETEIYTHFTNLTILRSLSKSTHASDINVHDLSSDEQKVYNDVCHLAFEKIVSSKQVLQQNECKFKLGQGNEDATFGLIVVDHTADLYGYEKIYTFLHLTFQEYLAACYISKLGHDKQYQIVKSHGGKNHMLNVWKFYCGLVEITSSDDQFKTLLHLTARKYLYHLQCAYESQQDLACTQVLKSMKYNIELINEYLSTPDFTAIGFVTSKSLIPTKLSLSNCNIDMEAISALLSEITDKGKPILKSIHYESKVVSADDISCIQTLQQTLKSSVEELSIFALSESDCALMIDSSFTKLAQLSLRLVQFGLHCTENFKLVNLSLMESVREEGGINSLAEFCRLCVNLKRLNISSNNIDDKRAAALANGLKYCSKLEEIILCRNELTKSGLRVIFNSLQKCHLKIKSGDIVPQNQKVSVPCLLECLKNATVYSLSLIFSDFVSYRNYWEDWFSGSDFTALSNILVHSQVFQLSGVHTTTVSQTRNLTTVLSHCSNLRVLNLSCDGIGNEQCVALSEGIKCCQNLKEIHLNENRIGVGIVEILNCCILSNLVELHLRKNYIFAQDLVSALAQCLNLRVLDLGNNIIGEGIEDLSRNLQKCSSLKRLCLDKNSITCDGAKSISSCLQYFHILTELDLSGNNIGSEGAKALAANLCHNTCLRKLDLSFNGIDISAAKAVISGFKHYGVTTETSPKKVTVYRLRCPSFEIEVKI